MSHNNDVSSGIWTCWRCMFHVDAIWVEFFSLMAHFPSKPSTSSSVWLTFLKFLVSKILFGSSNFTKLPFDLDRTGKGHLRNSFKRSQEVCVWGWWRHSVVLIYSRHERTKTLSDQSQLIKYKSRNGRKRVSTVRSCKTDLGTWLRK